MLADQIPIYRKAIRASFYFIYILCVATNSLGLPFQGARLDSETEGDSQARTYSSKRPLTHIKYGSRRSNHYGTARARHGCRDIENNRIEIYCGCHCTTMKDLYVVEGGP